MHAHTYRAHALFHLKSGTVVAHFWLGQEHHFIFNFWLGNIEEWLRCFVLVYYCVLDVLRVQDIVFYQFVDDQPVGVVYSAVVKFEVHHAVVFADSLHRGDADGLVAVEVLGGWLGSLGVAGDERVFLRVYMGQVLVRLIDNGAVDVVVAVVLR